MNAPALLTLAHTANALRTSATRAENTIYTHFEGSLPPEERLPTTTWRLSWCGDYQDDPRIFANTRPAISLKEPLPPLPYPDGAAEPMFDPYAPDVLARKQQRHDHRP